MKLIDSSNHSSLEDIVMIHGYCERVDLDVIKEHHQWSIDQSIIRLTNAS